MLNTKIKLFLGLLVVIFMINPRFVSAQSVPIESKIVINEVQTNGIGTGTTDQEFIELKNIGSTTMDISGWKLQYISSTGNLSTAKYFVTFDDGTIIYPDGYLLIAPTGFLTDLNGTINYDINSSFAGIASTGGTVALVNNIAVNVDLLGWGTKSTTICESELAPSVIGGSSLQRKIVDNQIIDTDNNKNDFENLSIPTPSVDNVAPIIDDPSIPPSTDTDSDNPPVDPPPTDDTKNDDNTNPDDNNDTNQNSQQEPQVYLPIELSELFIDPDSPLTDAKDEWVEIYNPNDSEVDLYGYTIFTGTNLSYKYIFTEHDLLSPHAYKTITSGQSSLSLANSGGGAKIVGPNGQVFDQITYTEAKTGESWAKNASGIWQWTSTPTQDNENVFTILPMPIKKAAASVKKSTSAKTTVAKAKVKTTKAKAAIDNSTPDLVNAPTPIPFWLLAVAGSLALLYACYEYRFDISNKLYQLRSYRANSRTSR